MLSERPTGSVRFEQMNVADEEAVVRSIAACEDEFGPITGVVNSAGIARDVPALDTSAEMFRRILEVNLIGSFVVSREAAKRHAGTGQRIDRQHCLRLGDSGERRDASPTAPRRAASITMTKVMAVELAPLGIRVNAIAPGPIETPLVQQMHTPEVRAAWMATVPQRRYGSPADIAGAAIFLLDDRKSSFVTGQTICVDGGFTIAGIISGTSVRCSIRLYMHRRLRHDPVVLACGNGT